MTLQRPMPDGRGRSSCRHHGAGSVVFLRVLIYTMAVASIFGGPDLRRPRSAAALIVRRRMPEESSDS